MDPDPSDQNPPGPPEPVETPEPAPAPEPEPAPTPEPEPPPASEPEQAPEPVPEPVPEPAPEAVPTPIASPPAPAPTAWNPRSAEEIDYLTTVLGPHAVLARKAEVTKRLDLIMEAVRRDGITDRTRVRLLLKVGKSTATRYLTTLVREGRLTRHNTRHNVIYRAGV